MVALLSYLLEHYSRPATAPQSSTLGGGRLRRVLTHMGGNLATGLFANGWMVRLGDADLVSLLALPGATPFSPMAGRTMRGYGMLPPDVVADDAALDGWLERAIAFARSLPPKS